MAFDQYHEPVEELDEKTRNFARMSVSLIEEAEAINWYQQRMAATKDVEVRKLLAHAQHEEFEHFAIDLEWLTRQVPEWRAKLKEILFQEGDILENAERHE